MHEYLESVRSEHRYDYDDFIRLTGMNYSNLYKLHVDAVAANDRRHEQPERYVSPIVVQVNANVLAYLTDIALDKLALGASLLGHVDD